MQEQNSEKLEMLYRAAKARKLVSNKEEFAKALDYSRSQLHRLMKGLDNPTDDLISKAKEFVNATNIVAQGGVPTKAEAMVSINAQVFLLFAQELAELKMQILILKGGKEQGYIEQLSVIDIYRELVKKIRSIVGDSLTQI